MAHTLYGSRTDDSAAHVPRVSATRARMRNDDVLFGTGTQLSTPQPTYRTGERRQLPPPGYYGPSASAAPVPTLGTNAPVDFRNAAAVNEMSMHDAQMEDARLFVQHTVQQNPVHARSDVAALQAQLRLCEHEIFTLRERLRLANESIDEKDISIASLQARLSGLPCADVREWCGGPCRGTVPLSGKAKAQEKKKKHRVRSTQSQNAASGEDATTLLGDGSREDCLRSHRTDGSDLEKQLDRDIAACQGNDELRTDDPDVAAWKTTNSLPEDPTARFVVPDLPSVHEGPDQFSEDGAMADLDREIRAALQLEDFEAHRYNLDLIQALEVDEGHLIDSD